MIRVILRDERPEDVAAIHLVNEEAFGRGEEARLVELLRSKGGILLSLVAAIDERIVGHILFTPTRLSSGTQEAQGAGLGPMAVLPDLQRNGIGGKLIREGTERMRSRGCPFIVVLGHPDYYPRFGFAPARRFGVRCEWDVPDEAFLLLPLDGFRPLDKPGMVKYRDEFSKVA
jgi:putative acetyltransferase